MIVGQVVRSLSGSDKNIFLVLVGAEDDRLLLCDGKRYRLSCPKRKNPKHVKAEEKVINLTTDKALRKALAAFREANDKEKSLCQNQI